MLVAISLLVAGAAVLTVGAEAAIRGAGRLAKARRISPFLLGALLFGVDVESVGAIQMVLLPAVTLLAGAAALADRVVSRPEGGALIGVYGIYLGIVIIDGRGAQARAEEIVREAEEGPRVPPSVLLVGGLALVYAGASVLVNGGVRLLSMSGLAAGFVGAAIIGALASLDEVFLEVLPVRRGIPELATGNLLGTVAAFSTGVLGLAALVRPLEVDGAGATAFLASAALYTVVATAFLARGRAGKVVGVAILALYGLWLAVASRL